MFRPIHRGPEYHAVSCDLSQLCKAEDLITAAVGKDRTIPADEPVEPSQFRDKTAARLEIEVKGIPQDDLRPAVTDLFRRNPLYRTGSAHRHEYRRVHSAMRRGQPPCPCLGAAVFCYDLKFHYSHLLRCADSQDCQGALYHPSSPLHENEPRLCKPSILC